MHGDFGLLINLSIWLVLALALGLITQRLRLSPIVGYLLAGVALGPQTPGFVTDPKLAIPVHTVRTTQRWVCARIFASL